MSNHARRRRRRHHPPEVYTKIQFGVAAPAALERVKHELHDIVIDAADAEGRRVGKVWWHVMERGPGMEVLRRYHARGGTRAQQEVARTLGLMLHESTPADDLRLVMATVDYVRADGR